MNYLKAIEKLENEKQYLLYYKRNVVDDLYNLTLLKKPIDEINNILMDLMNKQEFKQMKHIIRKYRKNSVSKFGDNFIEWYEKMLDDIIDDCKSKYYYFMRDYDDFLYLYIDYIDYKINKNNKRYNNYLIL